MCTDERIRAQIRQRQSSLSINSVGCPACAMMFSTHIEFNEHLMSDHMNLPTEEIIQTGGGELDDSILDNEYNFISTAFEGKVTETVFLGVHRIDPAVYLLERR